jgi:hypothetical protein
MRDATVVLQNLRGIAAERYTARPHSKEAGMDSLLASIKNAEHQEVAGVRLDVVRAGNARVKRAVYPVGFRWSTHMKPIVGTAHCMHAHLGFLARGHVSGEYADGCRFDYVAPQVVAIEPAHDAWVVGDEPAVVIELDAEGETARRFGFPETHRHS